MKNCPVSAVALLCSMVLALFAGCATPELTENQKLQIEQAVTDENPQDLKGRLRYLYDQRMEDLSIREAVTSGESSSLRGRQKLEFERSVKQQRRIAELAEADAEAARQAEIVEVAKRAERARQATLLAEQEKQRAVELEKQRKIAQAQATQRKINQPVHEQWVAEMQDLNKYFQKHGFEPANRLVDVYTRTMQYLIHVNPSEAQFSAFYDKFTDTEKLEHRRLFHNKTGTELIAAFWDQRQPSGQ